MKHLLVLIQGLLVVGCMSAPLNGPATVCTSDEACAAGQICFAEGCGDPTSGLVVEVAGGGQVARDFALTGGSIATTQNFDLGIAQTVSGEFQRELSATERTFYTEPVFVRIVGQSIMIPGVNRVYEGRFDNPERGAFTIKVGDGDFDMTATPIDRIVPPVSNRVRIERSVPPPAITVVFPSVEGAPALSGQLIKTMDKTLVPPEPIQLSATYLEQGITVPTVDVQLFDVQTNQTLSQRFPISASTGEFAITMSPEVRTKSQVLLVASPREAGVAIPTKKFMMQPSQIKGPLTLEYGDFGKAVEVTGTVVDAAGSAVGRAQVVLEGTVVGDGLFRSKIVETDLNGQFSLTTLPSKPDGTLRLTVAPPRGSRAAYSARSVKVIQGDGGVTLSPSRLVLDERTVLSGQVYQTGGSVPAEGVVVQATLQSETSSTTTNRALSTEPAEALTSQDGTFELSLDPGTWRLEYNSPQLLPISSRLITVAPALEASHTSLPPVSLSVGRTVSGVVTGFIGSTSVVAPVPYAILRFFHVTSVEGRPATILLGSSIADDRGRYQVILPNKTVGSPR